MGAGLRSHSLINYLITPSSLGVPFHGESLDGARFAMHTTASAFTQMAAVADGVGIAELPCCLADEYPRIERLWPNERPTMRTVWLVTHQDLRRAAKIRVVSNATSEAFERGARVLRFGRVRRASRIDTERSAEKPVIYASAPPAAGYVEKRRKVKRGFKKQVASERLSE